MLGDLTIDLAAHLTDKLALALSSDKHSQAVWLSEMGLAL